MICWYQDADLLDVTDQDFPRPLGEFPGLLTVCVFLWAGLLILWGWLLPYAVHAGEAAGRWLP